MQFRIGIRLDGVRAAQVVEAANVDEAIAMVRVGIWSDASVASVSIVKGSK